MWAVLVTFVILVIWLSLKWHFSYWKRCGVEGPTPYPVFGNLFEFVAGKKHFGEVYGDIYKSYPKAKYVGVYKMYERALLIRDLDLVNEVLVKKFKNFDQNDFFVNPKLDPLASENAFMKWGEEWRRTRAEVTPMFTMAKVRQTSEFLEHNCRKMVAHVNQSGQSEFEMLDLTYKYVAENVASCAFGLEGECFSNPKSEFYNRSKAIFQPNLLKNLTIMFVPWLSKVIDIRFLSAENDLWLRKIIHQVVKMRKECNENRNGFLQMLINLRGGDDCQKMTENQFVSHCLSFITEGTKTSNITMAYTIFELAKHPDVQEKVYEEILQNSEDPLSLENIQNLMYLDQVVSEATRIHPALLTLTKICKSDTELESQFESDQGSFTVEKGTRIIIPLKEIQNDERYFPNPEKFDPDRFSKANIGSVPKLGYLAFGAGPRICLGRNFALLQIKYGLAYLVSNYKMELASKMTSEPEISKRSFMLHCDSGIWIKLEKRK